MEGLAVAASSTGGHSILEIGSWIAQIVLGTLAIPTVWFGACQLRAIREDGETHTLEARRLADQSKATFLFELDKMFEGPTMMAARSNFLELGKDVEDHVKPHHDHLSHSEKRHQVAEEFARRLSDLRTQKLRSYIELMSLCGFFETAVTLVYKGYIDRDDIMQLYDGTIEQLFTATRIHIERRQEEMPPGYLENFKRLAESIPPRQIS